VNGALLAILLVAAAVIAWIVTGPLLRSRRRALQRRTPLSEADRMYLRRRVPLYVAMPAALRDRLDGLVNVFLAEKEFVGCQGLTVTRPMRLSIAAQACLLVLGRDEHIYDALHSVLVYPSQFVVRDEWHDEHGVVTEEERILSGQAWDVSRILLSWEDVTTPGSGAEAYNVVLHEFAHYLDHEAGGVGGAPLLGGPDEHQRWAATLQAEFDALRSAVDRGDQTLLDPYAAEDEAEFFAVVTEAFFEAPRELSRLHPHLYDRLREYYRLDPAAWS
jgi:Mlc titration factor MtfA (ptsG expression regulator)